MGHKWMWNAALGGLPSEKFLTAVDPLLAGVRAKLNGRYAASDQLAGTLAPEWAAKLGLRAGIPIPVGAFDAHWDAIGAGARTGDVVNVVGTSTCIIAMSDDAQLIPGVCGVVPGSVHPKKTGVEAGLSATGDIFDAIAQRANSTVAALSVGLESYVAGQTGLLRLTWDNGDRTVLVNPELGGITLGWNLTHTAQDELFAAIEGTAFHTRIILERMEEHGVPIHRVINGGGIPQKNDVLNHVYANVLNKPILIPQSDVTSLGSAIFAVMAAKAFRQPGRSAGGAVPEASRDRARSQSRARVRRAVRAVSRAVFWFWQAGRSGDFRGTRAAHAAEDCGERARQRMMLKSLREEVLEANLELVRRGLVLYTFGNASGISRSDGLVVIKPSGVPYEEMKPEDLVIVDLEGKTVEGKLRPSSDLPTHLILYKRLPESAAWRTRTRDSRPPGRRRGARFRASARRTRTIFTARFR